MSHSFVRSPECNGCIERFNRTVEEEVFSVNTFMTLADAEAAMAKFIDNYNRNWLIHRLDLQSPIEYRFKYENLHPSGYTEPEGNVSDAKMKKIVTFTWKQNLCMFARQIKGDFYFTLFSPTPQTLRSPLDKI